MFSKNTIQEKELMMNWVKNKEKNTDFQVDKKKCKAF